jgi:hypothetical protein
MYKAMLDKQLSSVFNKLKDLSPPAIFIHNSAKSFDFATGETQTTVEAPVTIKVVILKETDDKAMKTKVLLFKTKDVPNVSEYDTIEIAGVTHKVIAPAETSPYTTRLTVKEVANV